jgi:hypothetical protein
MTVPLLLSKPCQSRSSFFSLFFSLWHFESGKHLRTAHRRLGRARAFTETQHGMCGSIFPYLPPAFGRHMAGRRAFPGDIVPLFLYLKKKKKKKQVWELSRSKARSSKAQVVGIFRLIDLICVQYFMLLRGEAISGASVCYPRLSFATASGWLMRKLRRRRRLGGGAWIAGPIRVIADRA